jgi:hypothetical protein
MWILTDEDVELRFVNLNEFGLFEGHGGGRSRGALKKRHLAEDLLFGQRVDRVGVDHDRDTSPLDREHAVPLIALPEDRRPAWVDRGLQGVSEQAELPGLRAHGLVRATTTGWPSRALDPRPNIGRDSARIDRRRQGHRALDPRDQTECLLRVILRPLPEGLS